MVHYLRIPIPNKQIVVCVCNQNSGQMLGLILRTFCTHIFGCKNSVKFVNEQNSLKSFKIADVLNIS